MIYLDTSALIKLYLLEEGSESVQRRVSAQNQPLPVWEIQEAELLNALQLNVFWGKISQQQGESQIELFFERQKKGHYFFPEIHRGELMKNFRTLSRETARLGCRTMDIMHVACALQLGATSFITFDDRQRALAEFAKIKIG